MFFSRFHVTIAAVLLGLGSVAWPQNKISEHIIVIDGENKKALVYEIDGHTFIDLEELAKLAPRIVHSQGDLWVLNGPSVPDADSACSKKPPNSEAEMSANFMAAASNADRREDA